MQRRHHLFPRLSLAFAPGKDCTDLEHLDASLFVPPLATRRPSTLPCRALVPTGRLTYGKNSFLSSLSLPSLPSSPSSLQSLSCILSRAEEHHLFVAIPDSKDDKLSLQGTQYAACPRLHSFNQCIETSQVCSAAEDPSSIAIDSRRG